MKTYTGKYVDPFDLKAQDIDIVDIAHHLSQICRFNGASRYHYSVAQHSVLVAEHMNQVLRITRPDELLQGLLHDAAEAYLCDVPRPLKYRPEFVFYRGLEENAMMVIADKFRLEWPFVPEVKQADNAMLVAEGLELMNEAYTGFGQASPLQICQNWLGNTEASFLSSFRRYIKERACNPQVFGV